MKSIITILCLITLGSTSYAQQADWKEMHDFHAVMSKTFHPAEEGKLQPVKDSASVLFIKAKAWNESVVPEGYKATLVKPVIKRLVDECATIVAAVEAKKTDAELKALITTAHNTFHEIMAKCSK